jgi:5-methylcytosine-specific restriction endonuclease McrA
VMNLYKPVLKLNASYEPLAIITARRAIEMMVTGKAVGVDDVPVILVAKGLQVASVIRLRNYRRVPIRMQIVSRHNILIRDGNRCMYCGQRLHSSELTLDHILPRSRGGRDTWENLVACCKADNHRKRDRTPEEAGMKLIHRPLPQTIHTPRFILRAMGSEVTEWAKYLWHDSDGDRRYAFN